MKYKIKKEISNHPNFTASEDEVKKIHVPEYFNREIGDRDKTPILGPDSSLKVDIIKSYKTKKPEEKVFILEIEQDVKIKARRKGSGPYVWYFNLYKGGQ